MIYIQIVAFLIAFTSCTSLYCQIEYTEIKCLKYGDISIEDTNPDNYTDDNLLYKLSIKNKGIEKLINTPIYSDRAKISNNENHIAWEMIGNDIYYIGQVINLRNLAIAIDKKDIISSDSVTRYNYKEGISRVSFIEEVHNRVIKGKDLEDLYYDLTLINDNTLLFTSLFKNSICFYEVNTQKVDVNTEFCGCFDHNETINGPFRIIKTNNNKIIFIDKSNSTALCMN